MQKAAVAAAFGHKLGNGMKSGLAKDHAVKSAVDHVAGGTGKYQRNAYQKQRVCFFLNQGVKVPPDGCYGGKPEKAQQQLAPFSAKRQPEGHPRVFGKMYDKPVASHVELLPQRHGSFDINFKNLIQNQDHKDDNQRLFQRRKTFGSNGSVIP